MSSLLPRSKTCLWSLGWNNLIVFFCVLFLYQEAVSGILRYILPNAGLTVLLYIPSLSILGIVLFYIVYRAYISLNASFIALLLGILVLFGYSLWQGRSAGAAAYALYTWGAFLINLIAIERGCHGRILKHLPFIWVIACAGVLLNYFVPFPWIGTEFEVAGIQVEGIREWGTYGISRLPGFSRSSATAANEILIGFVYLLLMPIKLSLKAASLVVSLIAIGLTTSKTPLFDVILVPCVLLILNFIRNTTKTSIFLKIYTGGTLVLLASTVVLLPLLIEPMSVQDNFLDLPDGLEFIRLGSLAERFDSYWPAAMDLLHADGDYLASSLLGRGLGGIGVGQLIDEVTLYNAADNLFIFLWVTFGLPGLIVIYLIVRGGLISERGAVGDSSLYFCLSVSVLILGIFLSGIESGIISCMLGALAGRGLFRKTITVAETASRRARLVSRTPALVWRHTP